MDTRRKSEAPPPEGGDPTAEEPEEEVVAEERGEDTNDRDDDEEEAPKLEDGFYELEQIRKKRVRHGKPQFLIKWRGWPESANTWEPVENLESCLDIIEAFEERQRAGSSRKRRRSQSVRRKHRSARVPTVQDSSQLELFTPQVKAKVEANANCVDGGSEVLEGKAAQEANVSIDEVRKEDQMEADGRDDHQTEAIYAGNISIDLPSPLEGAKKCKSGSVRRFKQDTVGCDQEGDHNVSSIAADGPCSRNEEAGSTEDETSEKNMPGDAGDPPSISKIIMPVRYFASVTDSVQEVAIKFKALRSDGKEVLVDDKELKANNPHLLISYYEQHLRYTRHP